MPEDILSCVSAHISYLQQNFYHNGSTAAICLRARILARCIFFKRVFYFLILSSSVYT